MKATSRVLAASPLYPSLTLELSNVRRMRRSSLIVLFLALGLVLSACGSSSKSSSATSTTTTVPPAAQDKAKAQAMVLTQADVGAGFKPAADEPDDEETPEADEAFNQCSQNNPVLNSESEERAAESEFEQGELMTVHSAAELFVNEADVKAAFDILASDTFASCLDGAFGKLFSSMAGAEGASVGNIKTAKKAVTAAGADQATGLTTTMTISAGPVKVNLFLDMSFMRKGRAAVLLMAMSGNKPFGDTQRLNGILAQRLVANAS